MTTIATTKEKSMESAGDVNEQLKQHGDIFEAYYVSEFKCYRNATKGGVQELTVRVYDAGPDPSKEHMRYRVVAIDYDGKDATGKPAATVQSALAQVHWWDLDK
jgi:hypothetical protein